MDAQVIQVVNNDLINYNSEITEAALAEIEKSYKGLTCVYGDKAAIATVTEAYKKVKGYRVAVEKKREALKAPVLAAGRLIDSTAKAISARLEAVENPLKLQLDAVKAEEARIAAEAAAKEQARINAINTKIEAIRKKGEIAYNDTSAAVEARLQQLLILDIDAESFAEFVESAELEKETAVRQLTEALRSIKEREAQAKAEAEARAKAEAEAAELRAQMAAKQKEEAEARAKAEAEAAALRAQLEAMQKAQAEAEAAANKLVADHLVEALSEQVQQDVAKQMNEPTFIAGEPTLVLGTATRTIPLTSLASEAAEQHFIDARNSLSAALPLMKKAGFEPEAIEQIEEIVSLLDNEYV